MILTEKHYIKKTSATKKLYEMIDAQCFKTKNLFNATQYFIKQTAYVSRLLAQGELLNKEQSKFIYDVNKNIDEYNLATTRKSKVKHIDSTNPYIADAYFLQWLFKTDENYLGLGNAHTACETIDHVCKAWKSFFQSIKDWKKNPGKYRGMPRPPRYLDSKTGREMFRLKSGFKQKDGILTVNKWPGFFVKTEKTARQVHVKTEKDGIWIGICYEAPELKEKEDNGRYIGIDIGVDNLAAIVSNTKMQPHLISGRPLKFWNALYNKDRAKLASELMKLEGRHQSNRLARTTSDRNNKINNYLHKASREVVDLAIKHDISEIIIGHNKGWKQEVDIGKKNNQNFVSIPFDSFIKQIEYKAKLAGIKVLLVEESYTSQTSYLDREPPTKEHGNYVNGKRRKYRGLFVSNDGTYINSDINGAYQILKKVHADIPVKCNEKIEKILIK